MNFCLILTEGYAPFLSLANRGQIFSNDENPGPGHYDLRNALLSTVKVRLSYKFTTQKTLPITRIKIYYPLICT